MPYAVVRPLRDTVSRPRAASLRIAARAPSAVMPNSASSRTSAVEGMCSSRQYQKSPSSEVRRSCASRPFWARGRSIAAMPTESTGIGEYQDP
jgi:hypothetical protein